MIHEYLKVAFEEGDSEQLMIAIGNDAKAKGMSEVAEAIKPESSESLQGPLLTKFTKIRDREKSK